MYIAKGLRSFELDLTKKMLKIPPLVAFHLKKFILASNLCSYLMNIDHMSLTGVSITQLSTTDIAHSFCSSLVYCTNMSVQVFTSRK